MGAGFFGKLPVKRDFVASGVSRGFLDVWEPWLQASLATSRMTLGDDWAAAYNRAPIWRFWLGAQFSGEATVGALMASVDGVGRPFPLAVICGEGDRLLAPPEIESHEAWCAAAEHALLSALAPETTFESFAQTVEALPPPALHPRVEELAGVAQLSESLVLVRGVADDAGLAFRAARRFGHRSAFAGQTFWWTVGGEGFEALALATVGMPPPELFQDMLTGAFAKGRRMSDADPRAGSATHVGLRRSRNEDSFLLRPEAGLWAVADGMGGHGGGDVASRLAVEALARAPAPDTGQERLAAVEEAAAEANADIRVAAAAEGRAVMGTTLVALLIFGQHYACLWCGDSRAYLLRGGALRQLTRDHSEAQDLVDRGVLAPHEAKTWPRRSVLTRALGAGPAEPLDLISDRWEPGDAFLLCSDGLTAHCDDDEIAVALSGEDPQRACDTLIALTLQRGGSDNVTLIALRCGV